MKERDKWIRNGIRGIHVFNAVKSTYPTHQVDVESVSSRKHAALKTQEEGRVLTRGGESNDWLEEKTSA